MRARRLQTHPRRRSRELVINQVEVLDHDHIHVCDDDTAESVLEIWRKLHEISVGSRPIENRREGSRIAPTGHRPSELSTIASDVAGSSGFPCSREYPKDEMYGSSLYVGVFPGGW
jgi:hypothetical protein